MWVGENGCESELESMCRHLTPSPPSPQLSKKKAMERFSYCEVNAVTNSFFFSWNRCIFTQAQKKKMHFPQNSGLNL